MSRRLRWILPIALVGLLLILGRSERRDGRAALADDVASGEVALLKDQLEKGLRARRPIEFQFVRTVAQLVENGQLPRELVLGTFSWARHKYRDRKYLVPHFEQALRQRAAQEKITVLNNVPSTLPKLQ
jgi:hypothetical protein